VSEAPPTLPPQRTPTGRRPPRASSLIHSLNYAFEGIIHVLRTQRNMRIHVAASVAALIAGLALGVTRAELLALVFAAALVLVAEMINTAIEAAIDLSTSSFDIRAKIAKDVAAGAVLVTAATAVIVAYLVFADRIANPSSRVIVRVRDSPLHLTVIALVVTLLLVIVGKAASGRGGTPMSGGLPSGHAAIAFAAATAIVLVTAQTRHHVLIGSLAVLMAVLTAQSRVEVGIHTLGEVAVGALLGSMVVLAMFQVWS
jgi:diacylglycerol kinase (ATP)